MFFKKKIDRDELIKQGIAEAELKAAAEQEKNPDEIHTGNEKVDIELTKIKAQLNSLNEMRKADAERFSRLSEQLGELRGMIMDLNKTMGRIEVSSTKAIDLVESVHPERLMIEVRKQDGKVEALRANIESNEAMMKDILLELKKMREHINFFKGLEQVAELNEEVKQELTNMKKLEAIIEQHADKVETIFVEFQKRFTDFEKFNNIVKDLEKDFKSISKEFEKVKAQLLMKEDKKEFVDLLSKFNDFEKHTTNLLTLLDNRYKNMKEELNNNFNQLKKEIKERLDKEINELKSNVMIKDNDSNDIQKKE